jgi:hypothetical protein
MRLDFLSVGTFDSSDFLDKPLLEALYTIPGSHSIITGASYENSLGFSIHTL